MTDIVSAEIEPAPNQAKTAASAMQKLGFRILHIGKTVSVQGPQKLWEQTFNVSFKVEKKSVIAEVKESSEVKFQKAVTDDLRIPDGLRNLVRGIYFAEPPELF